MPLEIRRVHIYNLGISDAEFATRVMAFMQALADHRFTVNVPAPTEHPLVENAARAESYAIVDNDQRSTPIEVSLYGYIEAKADQMIEAVLPIRRQTQMLFRAHVLQRNERRNGSLTAEEQAEELQLDAAWAWAQSVRDAETAIKAGIDAGGITSIEAAQADSRWPGPLAAA